MSELKIDGNKCKKDGVCASECPMGIISLGGADGLPSLVPGGAGLCISCGHCVSVCPHGALSLGGFTPDAFEAISKDLLPSGEQSAHLMKSRRSIRSFRSEPVDRQTIEKMIDIARYAPTGHNTQPVRWHVIHDTARVKRLAALTADWMKSLVAANAPIAFALHMDRVVDAWDKGLDRIMRGAPHVIVAHADKSLGTAPGSCMIAVTYLELAAYSFGLGACWAGFFNFAAQTHPPLIEALGLPETDQPFGSLMIGKPKFAYHRIPARKPAAITWS